MMPRQNPSWLECAWASILVIAVVPQLAPPELAAWFHEQFHSLPSWASWGIAVLIGLARYRAAAATPGVADHAPGFFVSTLRRIIADVHGVQV